MAPCPGPCSSKRSYPTCNASYEPSHQSRFPWKHLYEFVGSRSPRTHRNNRCCIGSLAPALDCCRGDWPGWQGFLPFPEGAFFHAITTEGCGRWPSSWHGNDGLGSRFFGLVLFPVLGGRGSATITLRSTGFSSSHIRCGCTSRAPGYRKPRSQVERPSSRQNPCPPLSGLRCGLRPLPRRQRK